VDDDSFAHVGPLLARLAALGNDTML